MTHKPTINAVQKKEIVLALDYIQWQEVPPTTALDMSALDEYTRGTLTFIGLHEAYCICVHHGSVYYETLFDK